MVVRLNRRDLLRGSVLAALPGAGVDALLAAPAAATPIPDDPGHLQRLISFELLAVEVFALAERSRKLSPAARHLVREIRRQERDHATALRRELDRLAPGTPVPTGPVNAAEAEVSLSSVGIPVQFSSLTNERDWFHQLEQLELRLQGAYFGAIRLLVDAEATTVATQILGSEAQHQTALIQVRHAGKVDQSVPSGLVEGILKA
jgi:hypothetical protein